MAVYKDKNGNIISEEVGKQGFSDPNNPITLDYSQNYPTTPVVAGTTDSAQQTPSPITAQPTADNGFGSGVNPDEFTTINKNLYNESQAPVDPEAIRQQKLKDVQAQIDATNSIYADLIAKAQVEGTGRLGQQRAISARSGLTGSDFGAAQRDKVIGQNESIVAGYDAQKQNAISGILGQANQAADQEIGAKNSARLSGAKDYLSFLAGQNDRKAQNSSTIIQSLLDQNISPDEIPADQLDSLASSLQMTPQELLGVYKGKQKVAQDTATAASEKDNKQFLLDYQITKPYYSIGDTVYDSATGQKANMTLTDLKASGADLTDLQEVQGKPKDITPTATQQDYEYYKKDELAAGRTPLSFNDYQTMDSNRVKKSSGGGGTYTDPNVISSKNPNPYVLGDGTVVQGMTGEAIDPTTKMSATQEAQAQQLYNADVEKAKQDIRDNKVGDTNSLVDWFMSKYGNLYSEEQIRIELGV